MSTQKLTSPKSTVSNIIVCLPSCHLFKAFKVFVTLKLCVSPTELDPVGGAVTAEAIASAAVAAKSGGAASVEKREPGKVSPTV